MRDLAVYLTRSARTTKFRSFEGACAPFVGIVDAEKCLLFACACTVIWLLRFAYLPLHFPPLFTLTASGAADGRRWIMGRRQVLCLLCTALVALLSMRRTQTAHHAVAPGPIDPRFQYSFEASSALPDDRPLPDVRPKACSSEFGHDSSWISRVLSPVDYSSLPGTAVVIVEVNEADVTLRRTVTSVIGRSPPQLLHEVVIVDDGSDWPVDASVRAVSPKVSILTNARREGVVRSRLRGFRATTAPTVTFLDAHVEVNVLWLEPLLQRVAASPSTIVAPVIDVIHPQSFAYHASAHRIRGAFDWDLNFRWVSSGGGSSLENPAPFAGNDTWTATREERGEAAPVATPAIAGGLFTVDRAFFDRIGRYDEEFEVWGSENLELSFRAWMCGGSLEVLPCSRVGHVFRRASPLRAPAGKGGASADGAAFSHFQLRNKLRTALVWMDEYAHFVASPKVTWERRRGGQRGVQSGHAPPPAVASAAAGAAASASTWPISRRYASIMGNVSSRVGLRTHLRCRSFRWYLDHVWPDHERPVHPMRIRHVASRLCVDASSGEDAVSTPPSVGRRLELRACEDEYDASRGHGAGAPGARSDLQHFELISNSAELRLSPVLEGAVRAADDVSAARGGAGHTGTLCWRPTADAMHVELGACGRAQRWGRTSEGHLVHLSTSRCLVAQPVDEGGGTSKVSPRTGACGVGALPRARAVALDVQRRAAAAAVCARDGRRARSRCVQGQRSR